MQTQDPIPVQHLDAAIPTVDETRPVERTTRRGFGGRLLAAARLDASL